MVFNQGVFDVLGRGDAHNQFNDGVCEFITLINVLVGRCHSHASFWVYVSVKKDQVIFLDSNP